MAQLTIQQAFDFALQHHQAGRLREAQQLYQQVLAQHPGHFDAMYNLGVLALQSGRNDVAIDIFRQAVTCRPNDAQAYYHLGIAWQGKGQSDQAIAAFEHALAIAPNDADIYNSLGNALKDKGRLDDAISAYRKAIANRSSFAMAHYNLGNAHREKGQPGEAIAAFRQAIAYKPAYAEAHNNLGNVLREAGEHDEAIIAFRRAIALRPDLPRAQYNLGNVLADRGLHDEAIKAFGEAIALDPSLAEAHSNLGIVLQSKGRLDESIAAHRRAIAINPHLPEVHSNLGNVLCERGELDEAIIAYRQAIAARPTYFEAYSNLGNALRSKAELNGAITAYRQAIAIAPNYAEAHKNLALVLLALGHLQEGWEEYEWRWKCWDFVAQKRSFAKPQWDGGPLEDRTLLIHAEQGFGDSLQFIRYLLFLKDQSAKIIIECQPELERIFQTLPGGFRIIVRDQPLPAFDLHCPAVSLPAVFKTTLETIPADVPYLFPDQQLLQSWRQNLADRATGLKVGLAWAGNPAFNGDRTRSITLDRLSPLANVPGAAFYSLQKGNAQRQVDQPPAGLSMINLAPELHDFADTAAVMCLMDLIITTDTSVAHLAGALGRPVWLMLQFVPDWRWLLDRTDNPWYPSMRLFRQQERGDWNGVISRVVQALAGFASGKVS